MNYNDYMKEMEMQQQAKSRNSAAMPQYIYPPQPPMQNTTPGQIPAQNPARPPKGTLIQDPVTGRVFREGDMLPQVTSITEPYNRAVKAWMAGYRYEPPAQGGGQQPSGYPPPPSVPQPSRSVQWEGPGNPAWEKRMGFGQR
jgi:hypothetical protein